MIILGIDPGSRITGFGIIEASKSSFRYIDSGCIKTSLGTVPERLQEISAGITRLTETHELDEVAIEQVFMHRNADSALKLGQSRGAAIVSVVTKSLPIAEYSARQVKQAVVGTGGAGKDQVQHMVRILLNLKQPLESDASDALAVAICHANTMHGLSRMAGVSGVVRGRLR